MIIVKGIVLKQRNVGENDKYIDILTVENGLIEVLIKGSKKINSKNGSATQLFAYSKFCIIEKNSWYALNSAEPIHIFYNLRDDLVKISLASYFSDVIRYVVQEEETNPEILRLFLNTLYFLENNSRNIDFLKSLFEFRLASEIGLMPDIVGCKKCGEYEPEQLYFNVASGNFCCKDCIKSLKYVTLSKDSIEITLPLLTAIRHIVLSPHEKMYNFRISEALQKSMTYISEVYLLSHIQKKFITLDFYKSVKEHMEL